MIVLIARYHVHEGKVENVLEALERMKHEVSAKEPNCILYEASLSTEDSNRIVLYEKYADEAALLFHGETKHFKSIVLGEIIPMLESRRREILELKIS